MRTHKLPRICIPSDFTYDPRIVKLAVAMAIPQVQVIGHIVSLWTVTRTMKPDGNLLGLSTHTIASWADFPVHRASHFVDALVDAGFLEEDGQIAGWDALAGRDDARREKDAARKRRQRESQRSRNVPRDSHDDVTRTVTRTVPGDGSVSNSSNGSSVMSSNDSDNRQISLLDGLISAQTDEEISVQTDEEMYGVEPPTYEEYEAEIEEAESMQTVTDETAEVIFDLAWADYPKRLGGNSKADARKAFMARVRQGIDPNEMRLGVVRYAAYCEAMGMTGTQYVKTAATFFGPGLHFEDPFEIPANKRPGAAKREQPFEYAGSTELPPSLRGRREPPPNPDPGF